MDDEKTATITFIQKTIASVKMFRLVWKNRFLRTRKIQIELDSFFLKNFMQSIIKNNVVLATILIASGNWSVYKYSISFCIWELAKIVSLHRKISKKCD